MEKSDLLPEDDMYADKAQWAKFIDWALLGMGVAFAVAGIIFFFAYNWTDLHKFAKLGIIQALIILPVTGILILKPKELVKNIILSGVSVLAGLLFSVFGQIYQTGADAYDFFLGWTVFILLWTLVSNFAPLWLIFLVLTNTTLILYVEQVGTYWSVTTTCTILFALNTLAVLTFKFLQVRSLAAVPNWIIKITALAAVFFMTFALTTGIFDHYPAEWYVALMLCLIGYIAGVYYAFSTKSLYMLCIIPLSIIIILSSLILEIIEKESGPTFLFISLFVILSVSFLVHQLVQLNKKWHGTGE